MTDAEFLAALESARLSPAEFGHRAHLRAAWLYLSGRPFLEACIAMRDSLQRFAASIGKAGLYHETITLAFMSLVAEQMARHPGADWQTLLRLKPELCERDLLSRYYSPERLQDATARHVLLLNPRAAQEGKKEAASA